MRFSSFHLGIWVSPNAIPQFTAAVRMAKTVRRHLQTNKQEFLRKAQRPLCRVVNSADLGYLITGIRRAEPYLRKITPLPTRLQFTIIAVPSLINFFLPVPKSFSVSVRSKHFRNDLRGVPTTRPHLTRALHFFFSLRFAMRVADNMSIE